MKDKALKLAGELKCNNYEHIDQAADLLIKLVNELDHMEKQFDLAIDFMTKCNTILKDNK